MLGFVILGVFAAFGVLCVLWVLYGALLPGFKGGAMVFYSKPDTEEAILRRYGWLRDLGLVRCPLILLDSGTSVERREQIHRKYHNVEFYTLAEWTARLDEERKEIG